MAFKSTQRHVDVWIGPTSFIPLQKVGTLYQRDRVYAFEYDASWIRSPHAFQIDPDLSLFTGEQYTNLDSFGFLLDSAPDRWGRLLMDRREANNAQQNQRPPILLQDWDYLLGVNDETRLGALRFSQQPGKFLDDHRTHSVPPITSLRELESLARAFDSNESQTVQNSHWLSPLFIHGSSLGGARPKASFVHTDGSLWIAKFPARNDRVDHGAWEMVCHRLAKITGIPVPDSELHAFSDQGRTFCVKRFDRLGSTRRFFCSAMAALRKTPHDPASYLELVDFIEQNAAKNTKKNQLQQLWKRAVFNAATANRDDHLRNFGFIHETTGFQLSPAFDMNPDISKTYHSTSWDGISVEPTLDVLYDTATYYGLNGREAKQVAQEILSKVSQWREIATEYQIPRSEQERMESLFLK